MPPPQPKLAGEATGSEDREPGLETDDHALMASIALGDRAAFAEFVTRHVAAIVGYAARFVGRRSDAEDIAQEAFTRLWTKAPQWRAQGAPPRRWLFRVTYNLCMDELRRRRPWAAGDAAGDPADTADTPEESVLRRDRDGRLAAALAALPERQRRALALCAYEGLSNKQAAAALEIGVEALESLLARGRRKLRELLLAHEEGG